MRALTLTQPWAGLVASGIKTVENRDRSILRRADFGKLFGIHASREVKADVHARIKKMAPELYTSSSTHARWSGLACVTSAIIGVAAVERLLIPYGEVLVDPEHPQEQIDLGNQERFAFGPVVYVLKDVRALHRPVPCRGWQGFWSMPEDVRGLVMEQIG